MADIKGHRDLSELDIKRINTIKDMEIQVEELWRNITTSAENSCDHRWAAIARTHFEEGFSAPARSIAQPEARF